MGDPDGGGPDGVAVVMARSCLSEGDAGPGAGAGGVGRQSAVRAGPSVTFRSSGLMPVIAANIAGAPTTTQTTS